MFSIKICGGGIIFLDLGDGGLKIRRTSLLSSLVLRGPSVHLILVNGTGTRKVDGSFGKELREFAKFTECGSILCGEFSNISTNGGSLVELFFY